MPKALTTKAGALLDSWGRSNNRKLLDKTYPHCGSKFKPLRATSRYCSRPCSWANNGGHNAKHESWWINSRGYVEGRITVDGTKVRIKQRHRRRPFPGPHSLCRAGSEAWRCPGYLPAPVRGWRAV